MLLWVIAAFEMVPISLGCKENTYHEHNMPKFFCQVQIVSSFCWIINICATWWYVLLLHFGAKGIDVEYGIMPSPLPPHLNMEVIAMDEEGLTDFGKTIYGWLLIASISHEHYSHCQKKSLFYSIWKFHSIK